MTPPRPLPTDGTEARDPGAPVLWILAFVIAVLLITWCGVHRTGAVNERIEGAVERLGASAPER